MEGQLYKADRQLLHDTIVENKPSIVFEVGTWLGGGSTLSIAKALHANGKGRLYTIEMMKDFYDRAKKSYRKEQPELLPFIEFIHGESLKLYPKILKDLARMSSGRGIVDAVFLDGCGTKSKGGHTTSMAELEMFEPFMRKGGVFMMHDWRDAKAELVKPYLKSSKKWKVVKELGPPESIGFGKAIYLG